MEDEGRSFGVGFREQAPNHPKRHWPKALVVSVGEKAGMTCQVWIKETSASELLMTCRKVPQMTPKSGADLSPETRLGGCSDDCPTGVRHKGSVTLILASMRNVRTCRLDAKRVPPARRQGRTPSGGPMRSRVPMRGEGADEPVVAMKPGNAGGARGLDSPAEGAGQPGTGGASV